MKATSPKHLCHIFIVLLSILPLIACQPQGEAGNKSKTATQPATLKVALRVNPASYYWRDKKAVGFDYRLLQAFAKKIGMELKVVPVATVAEALERLEQKKVDIAAGALSHFSQAEKKFSVSDSYYQTDQYLIYRLSDTVPKRLNELSLVDVEISANPNHIEVLEAVHPEQKDSGWQLQKNLDSQQLVQMVDLGLVRYTLVEEHELSTVRLFYPYLRTAFKTSAQVSLVWLFDKADSDLRNKANAFFQEMKKNRQLDRLVEAHFGHLGRLSYAEKLTFVGLVERRLGRYKNIFIEAAAEYGLDWQFLACVAYQESHWNPRAVSPTGVKGMMMLTQEVSKRYGISNRYDAYQSIMGGARYLAEIIRQLPSQITEPDRSWMALIAYLVGYGHLNDAFRLTKKRGAKPNFWIDVSASLKLLEKPEWYQQSKHGKPRGGDAITYINNVRNYQYLLTWLEDSIVIEAPRPHKLEALAPSTL